MPSNDDRDGWKSVFDRIVPADEWPAVSEAGLFEHLDQLAADPAGMELHRRAAAAVAAIEADLVAAGHTSGLVGATAALVDDALDRLEWRDRDALVTVAAQAYYGSATSVGAAMVGFRAGGSRDPGREVVDPAVPVAAFDEIAADWDVIVIGAGAGGGVAAQVLAEAGARVLVLERGRVLGRDAVGRDHLRNHRSSILGHNTGPGPGNPRVHVGAGGHERRIDLPHDPRWHNNAMAVGGGTRVYQGMAWRFCPDDFAMAARYGVPDGSSLADWPLTYEDLAPHYDWVEWAVGVCGDPTSHRAGGPRTRGYPMPPLPPNREAEVLARGARALGLAVGPVPLLLNSVPHDGRPQCIRCGECVGFACPVGAKNGTYETAIPRALATGRAGLLERCRAIAVTVDGRGRVDGVDVIDEATSARRRLRAGQVVVAAGAIETARLLLASAGPHHPSGLGNGSDQVGRHLQGHGFVSAFGRFDEDVIEADGPGVSIATLDWAHGHDGFVGGGVVANEITKLPIVHWAWAFPPDTPRWGLAAKAAMRDGYRTTSHLFAQIQEIPRGDNRVTLSEVTDSLGLRVARLSGHAHPETVRTAGHVGELAATWLEASGASQVWTDRIPTGLLAGQHQAGTCRMGVDPATSVVDPDGRVHGHDNLWIADGSVHVTNGGVNPSLTIMALAHRTAGRMLTG